MTFDNAGKVRGLGLALTEQQAEQLLLYRNLLARSANEFNLTSLREPHQIERRHILESLAFGALLQRRQLFDGRPAVIDIGTGAGLPGIPLKIVWPALKLTLLESIGKKCRFLELAVRELDLASVEVIEGRAEDVAHEPTRREAFELVLARAVAPLAVLLEYSLPFLRLGGHLAGTKGSAAERELAQARGALDKLGGELEAALPFQPPDGLQQTVVIVRKTMPTPEPYPRRAGIPAKRPIL